MSGPSASAPWSRALVVGLGRSGRAAISLLRALGVHVEGYDARDTADDLPDDLPVHLGTPVPPDAALEGIDLLVLSPGVPPTAILERARTIAPDAAVHGELGLALQLVHGGTGPWAPVPTILITGTNGKSTVTALTGALLEAGDRRPFVGGNLGIPLCERLQQTLTGEQPWPDAMVIECSSYQLETLPPVPIEVAMVVNISPDHLDRYDSYEHYARTKARIFTGLSPGGLALLDADDAWTERLAPTQGRIALVGDPAVARLEGEGPEQQLILGADERYARSSLRIAGGHNGRNALFALLAARHVGVGVQACAEGLMRFSGLPHRMVLVRELGGVTYYNDSKATNVASALAGLGGLDRPFVLIAGGRSKGDDLQPLRELLAARGRGLVVVGDAAEQFAALGQDVVPVVHAGLMDDAVPKARALAQAGEAVVLAPACASFDQYRSYAQRGDAFTTAVEALA